MRMREPMLGHDLAAIAAPLVKWSAQVEHADEMAAVMARAFKIANEPPHGPVFVALPINVMEQETANGAWHAGTVHSAPEAQPAGLLTLAQLLASARQPAIVCGERIGHRGQRKLQVRRCITKVCVSICRSRTGTRMPWGLWVSKQRVFARR